MARLANLDNPACLESVQPVGSCNLGRVAASAERQPERPPERQLVGVQQLAAAPGDRLAPAAARAVKPTRAEAAMPQAQTSNIALYPAA